MVWNNRQELQKKEERRVGCSCRNLKDFCFAIIAIREAPPELFMGNANLARNRVRLWRNDNRRYQHAETGHSGTSCF
jgi:hypothetical protein